MTTKYINTVIGYSSAETQLDGASKEFPVPPPEEFSKNPAVVAQLYKDVEDFGAAPGSWRIRPTAVAPVYCAHDGVLANQKSRDMLRQPKVLLLETSVTAATGAGAEMLFTDVNTATAALFLDGAYSTFAIMHGGGKIFFAFCWNLSAPGKLLQYYSDISTIYEKLQKLKPADSPFHDKPRLEEDLEKQGYWQNFPRLPGLILSRGIHVFKTPGTAEPIGVDEFAASCGTKRAGKAYDLRESVWNGLRDITGTLDKLAGAR